MSRTSFSTVHRINIPGPCFWSSLASGGGFGMQGCARVSLTFSVAAHEKTQTDDGSEDMGVCSWPPSSPLPAACAPAWLCVAPSPPREAARVPVQPSPACRAFSSVTLEHQCHLLSSRSRHAHPLLPTEGNKYTISAEIIERIRNIPCYLGLQCTGVYSCGQREREKRKPGQALHVPDHQ